MRDEGEDDPLPGSRFRLKTDDLLARKYPQKRPFRYSANFRAKQREDGKNLRRA
jgi:hypothetical protein